MVRIKYFMASLLTAVVAAHAYSQDVWTLEECINYALENNIQYKRQKLLTETSSNNYLNSKLNLLPNLNGFAQTSQNWGTTFSYDVLDYVDQDNLDGYFGIQSNLELFSGLGKFNAMGQYKYSFLSNLQDVEKIKNNITLEIVATYLQILLYHELLKLAEDQLEITRQQVERTSRLVEVGNEPKGRLLEIQAQEALEKSNVTAAKNNLTISYLTLTQLLFLETAEGFMIETDLGLQIDEGTVLQTPPIIFDQALGIMPEIKSAEYFLRSEEKRLASVRGQRYPTISMSFTEYTRFNELAVHPTLRDSDPGNDVENYLYFDQFRDFRYRQVSLSFNIPIFNYWNVNTRVSNAKISVYDAHLGFEQTKLDLYRNIQQAHANAVAALENYNSNLEAVESQQEAFNYAEQRFVVGLISSVDYNIAKNNLTRAQSDLLQSKFQFIFRTKILDFYSGRPITL